MGTLDLEGKRVLVVGLGVSGRAAAALCHAHGADVTVTDRKSESDLAEEAAVLRRLGVRLELGHHRPERFLAADLLVLSPGVPDLPEVAAARAAGVPVTGELELASRFLQAIVVAITGTNGKSTTTSLVGAIARETGRPTFVGGNLGTPLSLAVGTPAGGEDGICVVEVSSFQAETIERLRPAVAACLNVTPDHLDRYRTMDAYAAAKARLFVAQTAADAAVLNHDDPFCTAMARSLRGRAYWFSSRRALAEDEHGAFLDGDTIRLRLPEGVDERYPIQELRLVGRHNLENAMAAFLCGRIVGSTAEGARRAASRFAPLAHRMELIAEIGGVAYFDDSKGTNVDAVAASIADFPRPVVLIAGGRDKGGDYAPLRVAFATCARGLVLIGEAADRIGMALDGIATTRRARDLDEAVLFASELARPGDAVVLSPACSSFDMFRNYEHRAQAFRAAVEALR